MRITEERLGKRIETEIANLYTEIKTDMANTKSELRTDMANMKSELIKWMFIFSICQFVSIVGTLTVILFAFFKS